jgi:hypothetical protein
MQARIQSWQRAETPADVETRTALGIQPHDELLDVRTQQAQRRVSGVGPWTELGKQNDLLSMGTTTGAVTRLRGPSYVKSAAARSSNDADLAWALHITRCST